MFRQRLATLPALVGAAALVCVGVPAQIEDSQDNLPAPVPPPIPTKPPPEDAPEYEPIVEDSDLPWVVPEELLAKFREKAEVYWEYAKRFACDETARLSDYDAAGDAGKERIRKYYYLLRRGAAGASVSEFRRTYGKDGELKEEVIDEEPFPPAYAWVFLFSPFHEPYFDFRLLDTRFDGFDFVHEVQFKGSLSFSDGGKDIRQWEGRVLMDGTEFTPLEVWAEPANQRNTIEARYRNWARSFSILGFKTRPAPLGYHAHIELRYRRDELTFPTSLRYDTFRAVSPSQTVQVKASIRTYDNYLFTEVRQQPRIGDVVDPP